MQKGVLNDWLQKQLGDQERFELCLKREISSLISGESILLYFQIILKVLDLFIHRISFSRLRLTCSMLEAPRGNSFDVFQPCREAEVEWFECVMAKNAGLISALEAPGNL